jgi:hypothetical protein
LSDVLFPGNSRFSIRPSICLRTPHHPEPPHLPLRSALIQQLTTDVLVMSSKSHLPRAANHKLTVMPISLVWPASSAQLCATGCRKRVSQSSTLPRYGRSGRGRGRRYGGGTHQAKYEDDSCTGRRIRNASCKPVFRIFLGNR